MKINRCSGCMAEIDRPICPHCGYDNINSPASPIALKRNTILDGRYLVGKVLGQGGFGITYVGFDFMFETKVAIKEYYPMGFASRDSSVSNTINRSMSANSSINWQEGCSSLLKEARKMAKLRELPNVVKVHDVFSENNTAYIVMSYIDGVTLKAYINKNGTMRLQECIDYFLPLIDSLDQAHKQGIIHRDISPDNIMLREDGSLCLLDLGAAKDTSFNKGKSTQLVAKKGFSPVEQYMNSGSTGPWTDVYAICATILYCVSGKIIPEAFARAYKDSFNIDDYLSSSASPRIKDALIKGLAVNPGDRIQSAAELVDAFNKPAEESKNVNSKPKPEPKPKSEDNINIPDNNNNDFTINNVSDATKRKKLDAIDKILLVLDAFIFFMSLKVVYDDSIYTFGYYDAMTDLIMYVFFTAVFCFLPGYIVYRFAKSKGRDKNAVKAMLLCCLTGVWNFGLFSTPVAVVMLLYYKIRYININKSK